jgi:2-iminobutanoate/2-iminopropanoate deaminase
LLSGQLPVDPKTGEFPQGGIREQARQVFKNMKAVIEAAGADLTRVVKTTVFLTDMNDFAALNEVYAQYFNKFLPARSTVQVAALPKNAKVEVEAIVYLPQA